MIQEKNYAIGLDLGGTKILAALIDEQGRIVHKTTCPTLAAEGQEAVIGRILSSVETVLTESGITATSVRGVGIATAGVIDTKANKVLYANNLGWEHVAIGQIVSERFGLPVQLINDANAAAVAEWVFGAGKGTDNVIYVTVSTGVGAGFISDGRLITGKGDSAGEFGHISIDPDGPPCACGNRGCLENYVSGPTLAKIARTRLANGEKSAFLSQYPLEQITAKEIGEGVMQGDPLCKDIHLRASRDLGAGITSLIHLFNPELIVVGGGVMTTGDYLFAETEKVVRERAISRMAEQVRLVRSSLGGEAGVLGAAGLFLHRNHQPVRALTQLQT
ncbi:UNVERIFIED_CONTAM: glucokinase [Brevibacillus sp. OAP136]